MLESTDACARGTFRVDGPCFTVGGQEVQGDRSGPMIAVVEDGGRPAPPAGQGSLTGPSGAAPSLLSSGGVFLVARVGTGVLNVLALAALSRAVPPATFGSFVLAQSVVTLGAVVATLGLEGTVVRVVAQAIARGEAGAAAGAIHTAQRIVLASATGLGILLVAGQDVWFRRLLGNADLGAVAASLAVWMGLQALNQQQVAALRGGHHLMAASLFDGFARSALFALAMAVLLGRETASLAAVLAAAVVATACSALGAGLWLRWRMLPAYGGSPPGAEPMGVRPLLDQAWPVMGSTVLAYLLLQGDLWLVSAFGSPADVARYGAATRILMLVTLPLVAANNTLSSTIASLGARSDREAMERVCRTSATAIAWPAAAVVALLVLAAPQVLGLVFGPFYAEAAPLLAVLALGRLVQVATGSCGMVLMMSGHQRAHLAITGATAIALVLGATLVAPRFGALGIAVLYAVLVAASNAATLLYVRGTLSIWTHAHLAPAAVWRALGARPRLRPS